MPLVSADLEDFSAFYGRHFSAVARAVRPIVGHQADDVAQEAFIRLHTRWTSVSGYDAPQAWVRRVAIRIAMRQAERDRLRAILEREVDPPTRPGPSDPDLERAIDELPLRMRAAVILHHLEDRPVSELAFLFGCSESSIKVWLHRARNQLADRVAGLRGTWVAESTLGPDDLVRELRGAGRGRFAEPVLANLPAGVNRWVISLDRGRFRTTTQTREHLDHGDFRVVSDRIVLRSGGFPGHATHQVQVDGPRLRLRQLENRNPVVYGVPDLVFQDLIYGSSAFSLAG
jgi:RNA polymerase sigma factor (sigma-70 family)